MYFVNIFSIMLFVSYIVFSILLNFLFGVICYLARRRCLLCFLLGRCFWCFSEFRKWGYEFWSVFGKNFRVPKNVAVPLCHDLLKPQVYAQGEWWTAGQNTPSIPDGYRMAIENLPEGYTADRPMVERRWRRYLPVTGKAVGRTREGIGETFDCTSSYSQKKNVP